MSTDAPAATYDDRNIKTLKDAAHIRQNPGMYVGNTQSSGLHHLVYEVVANSVDEALVGYCTSIKVALHKDGSISVADDGRGIPVGLKPDTGKSALEEAMTIAGTSGKFDNDAYRVSVGLHGMGAKAVNALSEWTEVEVRREGRVWKMEFEKGYATSKLQDLGPIPDGKTGTTITFKPDPDPEFFGALTFEYDTLAERLREMAYLNRGLAIAVADERTGKSELFQFEGGIAEYVVALNAGEVPVHAPVYIKREVEYTTNDGKKLGVGVEVAFQYTQGEEKIERCFTNGAYNPMGGTHLSGFRAGVTRAVNAYGKKSNAFKEGVDVKGEDFREGLTAVISLAHPDPLFESQTKVKLNNPEAEGIVSGVIYEALSDYLEKNPKEATLICKKIVLAAEARIAARKAREAIKSSSKLAAGGGLPGKLFDCTTRDRDKSELFLVEGDSAGGSAEGGRDRMFQAVLPLRGKVLNVEKARLEKLLKNNEIAALISAVGVDILNVEDVSKVRYGKIIILTDADVDGQHIRTLLLTFFFRQMRKLVEDGHVFVSRPPLYKVVQKKTTRFVQTRDEMTRELTALGLNGTALVVTGDGRPGATTPRTVPGDELGKMLPVLAEAETAAQSLERRGHTLESYLTRARDGVFPSYHVRFAGKEFWFHTSEEVAAFRTEQAAKLGRELVLADDLAAPAAAPAGGAAGDAPPAPPPPADETARYTLDEWHEVRALNRAMKKLKETGFEPADLIPLPRLAGRDPAVRFVLEREGVRKELTHLRELVAEVRKLGEKGMTVTRFKGLGEMDPEELWETTLDPKHRTMLKVTVNDAQRAEELFRTLMGEEVEGRKAFIMDHKINNPEDIDYGA